MMSLEPPCKGAFSRHPQTLTPEAANNTYIYTGYANGDMCQIPSAERKCVTFGTKLLTHPGLGIYIWLVGSVSKSSCGSTFLMTSLAECQFLFLQQVR
jgi:hypothetical protein